jgi:hypothetical protein
VIVDSNLDKSRKLGEFIAMLRESSASSEDEQTGFVEIKKSTRLKPNSSSFSTQPHRRNRFSSTLRLS